MQNASQAKLAQFDYRAGSTIDKGIRLVLLHLPQVISTTPDDLSREVTLGGSADFEIMAVATHSDLSNVKAFMQEFGMTFPVFIDGSNAVTDLYQVGPIPASFFVDREGVIRAVQIGQMDSPTLQKRLQTVR